MRRMNCYFHSGALAVLLTASAGTLLLAQAKPGAQRENDITRPELKGFDAFLDTHAEVARQLRQNPSLVNNEDYVGKHPELREFLNAHPKVREDLRENPRAFMNQERGIDRREGDRVRNDNDTTRGEIGRFDQFLDSHPGAAKELQKNPSLINNRDFLNKHPQLREYLNNHPGVREELKENPRAFMNRERNFQNHEGDQARQGEDRNREGDQGQQGEHRDNREKEKN